MLPWVLLPGTLCTQACFMPLLAAFKEQGVERTYTTFMAGETPNIHIEVAHMLGAAPDRFIACAFSLGGIIAMRAALTAPDRIAALVLISTNGRVDPAENAKGRQAQVAEAGRIGGAALVRDTLWPDYVAKPALGDHALRDAIAAMAAETKITRFANQAKIAISRPSALPLLGTLQTPILVVSGADDKLTPVALGKEIVVAAKCANHTIIPNAGHFVLMEKPEETARAILDWMNAIDPELPRHTIPAQKEATL